MSDPDLEAAKERGWRELADIDRALEEGLIDETGWHERVRELVEPAYLSATTPQGGSGKSGDAASWEHARRVVLEAVDRTGTFLDVGCANGLLMESVAAWSVQDGTPVEPYGVDISPALADLARARCPQWADRIWTANAFGWSPPRRFTFVRTGLDYVPGPRAEAYARHLLEHVVEPGGRLVVGTFNEERDSDTNADLLRSWGLPVSGRATREHAHPRLAYKVLWVDAG